MTWEEAVDLSDHDYRSELYSRSNIPSSIKSQTVRLHHQAARAEEEITRLKEEMNHCVDYYISKYECLKDCITSLDGSARKLDSYSEGSLYLLKEAVRSCKRQLWSLKCFTKYTDLPQLDYALCSFSSVNSSEISHPSGNLGDAVDDIDTTYLRCPEDTQPDSPDITDDESTDDEADWEKDTHQGTHQGTCAIHILCYNHNGRQSFFR